MNALSNLKVSHKLLVLMSGLAVGFIVIGAAYFVQVVAVGAIDALAEETAAYEDSARRVDALQLRLVQNDLLLLSGASAMDRSERNQLMQSITAELEAIQSGPHAAHYREAVQRNLMRLDQYEAAFASARNATPDELALHQERLGALGGALEEATTRLIEDVRAFVSASAAQAEQQAVLVNAVFVAVLFVVAIGAAVGMYLIYTSIVFPLLHMQRVIQRVNEGDSRARMLLRSFDEFGDLARAFDNLFDDRIQTLETQSRENDRLNNSIIDIIKALGTIAKRDLSVKVPVSEDVTGTVADAVNLLTTEMARTLHQVIDISEQVATISQTLNDQSARVIDVAELERNEVVETSAALESSATTLNRISTEAEQAGSMANTAIANTRTAQQSVSRTVAGINSIREVIAETEKRIKRLGERSQEITGIVNVINSIAERTHILALNASMHAASAGEAGRGFAVVAAEVQRLAESAREATAEISQMVNNIRVETTDAVTTMNKLISEVAEGTNLAEQAGAQMKSTEESTEQLVATVLKIAEGSVQQARIADGLRDRAGSIRQYTEQTREELAQQREQTEHLMRFARVLVERVNVFRLPAPRLGAPEARAGTPASSAGPAQGLEDLPLLQQA